MSESDLLNLGLCMVLEKFGGKDKILRKQLWQKSETFSILSDLCYNLSRENLELNPAQRERLLRFKKELRIFLDKKKSRKKRLRALLLSKSSNNKKSYQKGGALLGTLLSVGLPFLASLVGDRLLRRRKA